MRHHRLVLVHRPVWLFSSGPVGDLATRHAPVEPKEVATLRSMINPREHRVFGGALDRAAVDRSTLGFAERLIAKTMVPEGDYRDWKAIEDWAARIAARAGADTGAPPRGGSAGCDRLIARSRSGFGLRCPEMAGHDVPDPHRSRSLPLLRLFGVRAGNAFVVVDDELDARFGFFRVRTPVTNIVSWRIEGPWRWITAIGVRRSVRHGDVTFGGSPRGGVRVDFREPVRSGPFRIPALYVTVEDLEGLAAALAARGIPGRTRGSADPLAGGAGPARGGADPAAPPPSLTPLCLAFGRDRCTRLVHLPRATRRRSSPDRAASHGAASRARRSGVSRSAAWRAMTAPSITSSAASPPARSCGARSSDSSTTAPEQRDAVEQRPHDVGEVAAFVLGENEVGEAQLVPQLVGSTRRRGAAGRRRSARRALPRAGREDRRREAIGGFVMDRALRAGSRSDAGRPHARRRCARSRSAMT